MIQQQTIYVPRKLGDGDLVVYKRDKHNTYPIQFVEKQENKIVLDLEELKNLLSLCLNTTIKPDKGQDRGKCNKEFIDKLLTL